MHTLNLSSFWHCFVHVYTRAKKYAPYMTQIIATKKRNTHIFPSSHFRWKFHFEWYIVDWEICTWSLFYFIFFSAFYSLFSLIDMTRHWCIAKHSFLMGNHGRGNWEEEEEKLLNWGIPNDTYVSAIAETKINERRNLNGMMSLAMVGIVRMYQAIGILIWYIVSQIHMNIRIHNIIVIWLVKT